jgi:hypothetical protein
VNTPARKGIHAKVAVPKLCQNPIRLGRRELQFEREQLPQVVDNRHFRIELMECLEPEIILRNQQVSGSIPEGGSIQPLTLNFRNGFRSHPRRLSVHRRGC